jgi:hypothetical protein
VAGVLSTGAGVLSTGAGVVSTGAGVVSTGAGVVSIGAGVVSMASTPPALFRFRRIGAMTFIAALGFVCCPAIVKHRFILLHS